MIVVIFGPPGAGKGTQSKKIAEALGLTHFCTGDMLRAEMKSGTELGEKIKYISQGGLVDDETINERLNSDDLILDGYPRSVLQASSLDEMLKRKGFEIACVISLEVETEELVRRIKSRGQKSGRLDDADDVIQKRLSAYTETTLPVKDYYGSQGKLVTVDGSEDVDKVYEVIKTNLEHFKK